MEVMIPVWQQDAAPQLATSDLAGLNGTTIAIVDDGYDTPFTNRLEELLRDLHGAVVHTFLKPLGSAPSPKHLIEAAAQSRVAVVGIGL